ncbi:hypothetical protein [Labrenzia sp. VG12]|uniref:hypothetical protein n=1 Tax=Labrenzia sp. VG12 TaxID=2021862 RepID=UPI0012FD5A70|nr:hypothetical protein [Labrenzia sp. VG12]
MKLILSPIRLVCLLVGCLFLTAFPSVSQAFDTSFVDVHGDPVASFVDAYPLLETTYKSASLTYYAPEICGSGRDGNCEAYEFSCQSGNPDKFSLRYWGYNLGHANFSGSIMSGHELPHAIYFDRFIRRHGNDLKTPLEPDLQKARQIVRFHFSRGERLPQHGEHAYLIEWDTQTSGDADDLAATLASGETVLVPYPVRLRRLIYNRLHPKDAESKNDVAHDFVATCRKLWGTQR